LNVYWRTSLEEANQGFKLYARVGGGSWELLTAQLIPTRAADDQGADYRLELPAGKAYQDLTLSDVDLFGAEVIHGPFRIGQSYGHSDQEGEVTYRRFAAASDTAFGDSPQSAGPQDALLEVTETGIQRLTYRDLKAAGVDFRGVAVSDIALMFYDEPVPISIGFSDPQRNQEQFGPGAWIEFVAQKRPSLYSDSQVYRLYVNGDQARRIAYDKNSKPAAAPLHRVSRHEVRWEPDVVYSRVSPTSDPWYARKLSAIFAPLKENVYIDLKDVDRETGASMRIDVWATADNPKIRRDHHLRAHVNGVHVGDVLFDGYRRATLRARIPRHALKNGRNRITLELPLDRGSRVDTVSVEGISINYQRRLNGKNGHIRVSGIDDGSFDIRGFKNGDISAYRYRDSILNRVKFSVRRPDSGVRVRLAERFPRYARRRTCRLCMRKVLSLSSFLIHDLSDRIYSVWSISGEVKEYRQR